MGILFILMDKVRRKEVPKVVYENFNSFIWFIHRFCWLLFPLFLLPPPSLVGYFRLCPGEFGLRLSFGKISLFPPCGQKIEESFQKITVPELIS